MLLRVFGLGGGVISFNFLVVYVYVYTHAWPHCEPRPLYQVAFSFSVLRNALGVINASLAQPSNGLHLVAMASNLPLAMNLHPILFARATSVHRRSIRRIWRAFFG